MAVLNQVIFFSEGPIPNIENLISQGILEELEAKKNSYPHRVGVEEIDLFMEINDIFYYHGFIYNTYTYVTRVFAYKEKDLLYPAMVCGGIVYKIEDNYKKLIFYKNKIRHLIDVIHDSTDLIKQIDNLSNFTNSNQKDTFAKASDKQLDVTILLKASLVELHKEYAKEFQIHPIPWVKFKKSF